jgi:riboflavin transporter FmnP
MSTFLFLRGLQFCLAPSQIRKSIVINNSDQAGKVSHHFFGLAVAAYAALFFATISSYGLQTTGSILGTLFDQSGAVIVNTTVALTDIGKPIGSLSVCRYPT